ncbi:hypothetical protein BJ742DRAFT_814191 [Cladochytrium replicatum]|nr:hypothetical protein BJ742DRAFT_814191 [Cladochytrium replicatum]
MDVDWCHEDIKTREYDKIYEHGEQNDDSSSSNGEASENMDNNSTEEIEIEEEYLANYASVKVTGESEEDFVARVTRWLKAPVENIGKSLRTGRNHTSQIRGMPASTPLASRSLGFDRDQMLSTSSANLCSGDIVVPPRPLISSTHRTPFVCFTFCVLENIDILSSYNVFDSSLEAGGSLLDGHHTPFPAVEVCRPTILRNVRITNASSLCGISAYRLQGPNGGRRCVGGMHHVEALGEKTLLIMQNCVVQSISSSPRTHWEYRGGSEGEINGDDDVEIGCGCSSGLCLNSNFPSSPSAFSASPSTFGEPVFVAIDEADSPGTIPDSFPNPGPAIMMDPDVEFVEGEISGNRIRAYSKGLSALGNQVIWLSPTPTSSVDGEEDDGSEEARRQVEEIVRKMIKCGNSVSTF